MARNKLARKTEEVDPDARNWTLCESCGYERRIVGGLLVTHRRYNGHEMVDCPGSQAPASAQLDAAEER